MANIKSFAQAFSKACRGCRGTASTCAQPREAPRRGEQTGRANHPVDGSLDRLCDPVGQKARGTCPAKCLRFAEIRLNRPVPRQRTRTKRRFRRDLRGRHKWRPDLAPSPAQSSLIRARWEQRAFWGAPFEVPLRPGARKGVPVNHPPDGSLPLFAHLFRGNAPRSLSAAGLCPAPRRLL